MQTKNSTSQKISFLRTGGLLAIFLFSLFALAACGGKDLEGKADFGEEVVELPVLPEDDGLPLSAEERKAMQSTGKLDAGLSTEELRQVQLHFKFYVHKHRKTLERYLARSEAYLPYVRQVLRERGLPEEIAYLPFVESGFNPNAVSPVGAVGMWQFMPFTGRKYGLSQDSWVDERRDPFKATGAAADYLTKLHGDFNDWLFAISAYNAGEGKIGKAIECTGADDFFELCRLNPTIPEEKMRLKDETQQYVPRFLAFCKIMRNLEILGFAQPNPTAGLDLAEVSVPAGTDLQNLAAKAGWSWEDFSLMNPAYRRKVSPPSVSTTAYVPKAQTETITAWLATPDARIYAGWKEYKVRKGDTVASVAKRYGVSSASIKNANRLNSDRLAAGQTLMVPGSAKEAAAMQETVVAARTERASAGGGSRASVPVARPASSTPSARTRPVKDTHTVGSGETIHSISRRYGITPEELRTANGLAIDFTALRAGQKLLIPAEGGATGSSGGSASSGSTGQGGGSGSGGTGGSGGAGKAPGKTITVQSGDTLYSLASRNNTSVESLRKANGLGSKSSIKPGQKLRLP